MSTNGMSTRYNVAIIGYSWAATAHIGAIAATSKGCVTDVMSSDMTTELISIRASISAKVPMVVLLT